MTLYRKVRRVFIAIIGSTILLIGVLMIATPGPSILVIPLGLAILATEFIWARRLLTRLKGELRERAGRPLRWFKERLL